jgi:hypothetical protein
MNKKNRDAEFKRLGGTAAGYKKTSMRNQLLHPMHLEDYEKETGHVLSESDKGFGNGIYRTYFKAVYSIERINSYY